MFKYLIFVLILVSLSSLVIGDGCVYYFHGDGCDGCPETNQYMKLLQTQDSLLQVENYEVYYSADNFNLLKSFFTKYNVPKGSQGLPVVFTSDTYFVGQDGILSMMSESISSECPSLEKTKVIGIVGDSSSKSVLESLTFFNITGAAFSNAFTTGPLALFLVLLVIILGIKKTQRVLIRGLSFIIGIYLAYLLFGFGLFSWFAYSGIATIISKFIAILVILFSLASMKHFFISWEVTIKKLSKEAKAALNRLVELITSYSGTLILGLILGLLSFTNINKTFLLSRYLFMEGTNRLIAIPIMIYYLLIFVLPMLFVVVLIFLIREYWEMKAHKQFKEHDRKANAHKKHYLKVLNFIILLFLFFFGILVLFL